MTVTVSFESVAVKPASVYVESESPSSSSLSAAGAAGRSSPESPDVLRDEAETRNYSAEADVQLEKRSAYIGCTPPYCCL